MNYYPLLKRTINLRNQFIQEWNTFIQFVT
jgi:hypothetical protein